MKKLTMKQATLALKLRKQLRDNIVSRYDNSEYWDFNTIESFKHDNKLTDNDIVKITQNF